MAINLSDTSQFIVLTMIAVKEYPAVIPKGPDKIIKAVHPDLDLSEPYASHQTGPYTQNMACEMPLTSLKRRFR